MSRKKEMKLLWDAIRKQNETIESHNHTLADIIQSLQKLSGLMHAFHSSIPRNPN